nr:hypothetical protein [Tanacetum cinerariifolium]
MLKLTGCALLRKKFKEDLFTYCNKYGIFQDSSKPSNDNTNVVNAPQEPFDPGENSSQSPSQITYHCCYGCGNSLDGIFCQQCTYSLIISASKIDSFLDEFAGELILLKSITPRIDEADCDPEEEIRLIEKLLYDNSSPRHLEAFISENSDVAIKSFSPSPILVEDCDSLRDAIDLSLTLDDSMPPSIADDDYDSEGDILILEELLSNHFLKMSHFILIFHHPLALL